MVDLGLVKRIGVSNFDETNMARVLRCCKYHPYANQLEIHPKFNQRRFVKWNQERNIRVIAWSPLAKYKNLAKSEALLKVCERKNKDIVQVVLRWHFQNGISTIPRSSKPSRIVSNANIFDFQLTEEEMEIIDSINEDSRLTRDWIGIFDTTPYFPYKFPIGFLVRWLFRIIFFVVPNRVDLRGNPFNK